MIAAQMVSLMLSPSGTVQALVMCLSPQIGALAAWLESVLAEQAAAGRGLLRLPGAKQDGPERSCVPGSTASTKLPSVHEPGAAVRARRGRA
ncbi:hypothetical protein AB0454_31300 [Streptomyces sp. NPDC093509]|uniref:hypothetical protein n=1 Tax=Streptomyces sp. NPDC093509 TaxID=3154982 RepID=UPI00344F2371